MTDRQIFYSLRSFTRHIRNNILTYMKPRCERVSNIKLNTKHLSSIMFVFFSLWIKLLPESSMSEYFSTKSSASFGLNLREEMKLNKACNSLRLFWTGVPVNRYLFSNFHCNKTRINRSAVNPCPAELNVHPLCFSDVIWAMMHQNLSSEFPINEDSNQSPHTIETS